MRYDVWAPRILGDWTTYGTYRWRWLARLHAWWIGGKVKPTARKGTLA